MRPLTAACTLALAGCSTFGFGGGRETVRATVRVHPDTALRIAATQLQHHGYTVTEIGNRTLITQPKVIPEYLRELSNKSKSQDPQQQWILRVQTERAGFISGSHITVAAYLVPRSQTGSRTAPELRRAIPVTEDNPRLFGEVQTVAGWITDAANRRSKR